MSITVRQLCQDDLEKVMVWRMDEDITKYMNTNPKLTLADQQVWYEQMKKDTNVSYWIITIDEQDAGVISLSGLNREDGNLAWAYYIGEKKLRSLKVALSLEMSLYDYIFEVLHKNSLTGDIFSLNQGVIKLHQLCGSKIMEEKKNHILKDGIYYDVTFMRIEKNEWLELRATKKYDKISFNHEMKG